MPVASCQSQPLREYQRSAIREIESAWRGGNRAPLLVMPTGAGKTRVMVELAAQHRGRVLVLVPWKQLVYQTAPRLEAAGCNVGILMGRRKPTTADCIITTVQTACRRRLGDFDLVVIDEAHRAMAKQCRALLRRYDDAHLLGMTATPIRMDGRSLAALFDRLVQPVTTRELIRAGTLALPVVYAPVQPLNTTSVRFDRKSRDWQTGSLGRFMSRPQLLGDLLRHWNRHARNMRTLIFCVSVQHAKQVAETLEKDGGRVAVMTGKTGKRKRQAMFEALVDREIQALCNVAVLTEGIDLPEAECLILARPTLSPGLAMQIIGRGLRRAPGKSACLYLDHADVFRSHDVLKRFGERWDIQAPMERQEPERKRKKTAERTGICSRCGRRLDEAPGPLCECGIPEVRPGELSRVTWRA